MRVKPSEIILSITLCIASILGIQSETSYYKGFPVYAWVEYILLAGGLAIPILAWFLRSPSRKSKE